MNNDQKAAIKARVERLRQIYRSLREELAALRVANQHHVADQVEKKAHKIEREIFKFEKQAQ